MQLLKDKVVVILGGTSGKNTHSDEEVITIDTVSNIVFQIKQGSAKRS